MNVNNEVIELKERIRKLEEVEKTTWQGFSSVLGTGFVFVGGCVLCMLTISQTPHWVLYLIIGGIIFTALLCSTLFYFHSCAKKEKKNQLEKLEIIRKLC